MQIENYLKKYQPVIYRTFVNSLTNKKLSHAYLLVGSPGTPLLDTAKYLAKSILCDDKDPLACNNCITCIRIDSNNYADFVLLDGEKGTIKKEMINQLEGQFEKKAIEDKGIMIYILHLVENMTVEAVNSILKFLEEPDYEVYAFLTTNNESNILPTIVSRCQNLYLKQIDKNEVINSAIEFGIEKEDAELLSYFYNDGELICDFVRNEEENELYFALKKEVINYFNAFIEKGSKAAIFHFQTYIIPLIKNKESCRFLIDMFIAIYENIISISNGNIAILSSYDTMLSELSNKLSNINESLVELLKQRNLINSNVNTSLLLDHLNFKMIKEAK